MKLYLVRHATAADSIGGTLRDDAARPLVKEGRQEAELVAEVLRQMGIKGEAFVTSPLVRARQTAEIFAEVLEHKDKPYLCDALAPNGRLSELYSELANLKQAEEIFLFGHMPDMTMLAGTLLFADDLAIPFKKSAVCRIDIFDVPPTQPGHLKWFITPKMAQALRKP